MKTFIGIDEPAFDEQKLTELLNEFTQESCDNGTTNLFFERIVKATLEWATNGEIHNEAKFDVLLDELVGTTMKKDG